MNYLSLNNKPPNNNIMKQKFILLLIALGVSSLIYGQTITTFPYSQNFDEVSTPNLPADWAKLVDTQYGTVGTLNSLAHSSPNCVDLWPDEDDEDYGGNVILISPPTHDDLATSNTRVKFYACSDYGWTDVYVGTMSDKTDASTFSSITKVTLGDDFSEYTVNVTSDTKYIAFKHDMSDRWASVYIDNFLWEEIPTTPFDPHITSFPYLQQFDEIFFIPNIPPDWSKIENAKKSDGSESCADITTSTGTNHSDPCKVNLDACNGVSGDLILITPPTNLNTSNTRIKFWARTEGSSTSTQDLIVGTMSDKTDPATFTAIETVTINRTYAEYTINVTSNTGYIGLKHGLGTQWLMIYIDDFTWEKIPTTWTGATDQNWNDANNWNSVIPGEFTDVTIPSGLSNYPSVTGDAVTPSVCNNLTIDAGATITIPANKALTVSGTLSNSGTLTIESTSAGTGSLIHNTASISGIFQHYIAKDNTWHDISVPFSGTMPEICNGDYAPLTTNFNGTTNPTYDFFLFNEAVAEDNWINLKTTGGVANTSDFGSPPKFDAGTGYLVAYDNLFAGNETKSATGTFTNDSISIPLTITNLDFNLVGNPYPSSIDWKATSGWTRDNITVDGGYNLWIWNGSSGQYGAYNSSSDSDNGTNDASRYISPGQGLYVQALSAGNLVMTNDVRVHSTKKLLKSPSTLNNFRMSVTGDQTSYSDEIMIEFDHSGNTGGAQKLHSMYSNAPSLSTTKNNANYSIDFRTSIDEQSQIPISFSAGVDGVYTFNAQLAGGFEEAILEDLQLNNKVDLTNNPQYVFGSSINDDPYRFILHFASVGIDEEIVENSLVQIWSNNNIINIINTISRLGEIKVFNLMGQTAGSFKLDGSQQQKLELNLQSGIYIVTVSTSEGSIKSEKVIISNN
jgi:hypothetical protein